MDVCFSVEGKLDGRENMARDARLIELSERDGRVYARIYDWDGPWVTLGKFQDPAVALVKDCPVPFAMRPTGGRAVLHGHDITFSIAVPLSLIAQPGESLLKLSRQVTLAYRRTVQPAVLALRDSGIDAVLGEEILPKDREVSRSSDCFAHLSANDILNRKSLQKVCGIAMALTPKAVLVQASIPVASPLVDPATVYPDPASLAIQSVDREEFANALNVRLCALVGTPYKSDHHAMI